MGTLIRAAALSGYPALAASLGLDVERQLRRVGIAPRALHDAEALLPYRAMVALLEHSARDAACSDFGLRLASHQGLDIIGPVAMVLEYADTLNDAIELATRYLYVHSPGIRMWAEPVPGRAAAVDLCYSIVDTGVGAATQVMELAMGVKVQCLRVLTEGRVAPIEVMLPHARLGPLASYTRTLLARVSFERPRAAIRLRAADLSLPLPHRNRARRELAQRYLDTQFAPPHQPFSQRVRLVVRQLLGTGRATHEVVAEHLALHPRTMQRRLAAEGFTFEAIKDELRRDYFRSLVERPDAPPIAMLSTMLDYAEPSALTRSCRRWFGVVPSALTQRPTSPRPLRSAAE